MLDADDVNYFVFNFDCRQLRELIHWAEVKAFIQEQFSGTPYRYFMFGRDLSARKALFDMDYTDFVAGFRLALDIRKWIETTAPTEKTGGNFTSKHKRVDVETIKRRADLVDLASQYTQLTKSGKTFRGLCPLPGHSKKSPSFYVYPESQTWWCFGACNTGLDAKYTKFVTKYGPGTGKGTASTARAAVLRANWQEV